MKKLLLLFTLTLGCFSMNAQLTCANAVNITTNGTITAPAITGTFLTGCYSHTFDNTGTGAIHGIWYTYTPASTGEITMTSNLPANVAPNSIDTKVSIYTGTCGALVCYDVNDDTSTTQFLSTITFPVVVGTTYYIQWDNYWNSAGFNFDFTFTPNTCIKPYYFNAPTNITNNTINLSWANSVSNPASYDIEYGITGFTQGTGTPVNTLTNSYAFTGLTSGGVYDFYFRSNCGATQSAWTSVRTYSLGKLCPYSSGFDDAAQLSGWTTSSNTTTQTMGVGATAANAQSPSQYFILNNSTTQAVNNWLFSPAFYLTAGESVTTSFWTRCATARSFKVTVGNSSTSAAQTTVLFNNAALLDASYAQHTASAFLAPSTGIYYFGFNDYSAQAASAATLRLDTVNFTSVLSTNEFLSSKFSVYPNPAKDFVTITNDSNAIVSTVEIADMNGRVVKSTVLNDTQGQITTGELAIGVYMMKIATDIGTVTKKIVKE